MEQLSPEREKRLAELEKKLGTSFLNKNLFNQSLTHSSFGNEKKIPDNERLEFLGDAILKLVISEYIYHKFPDRAEGALTKIRAAAISDDNFSKIGARLSLGSYLLMSDNEKKTGGVRRKSNQANAFEAIIGALFLDAGLGKSRELILRFLFESIEKFSRKGYISDFKSALQEYAQKKRWELPKYRVIKETGLKHRRVFWIEVKVKGRKVGLGRGGNKKEAQQRAAMQALNYLKKEQKQAKQNRKNSSGKGIGKFISSVRKKIKI